VLLSTQLAAHGSTVTIIDPDPNELLSRWSKRPGKPDNLSVLADVTEETIIGTIEVAAIQGWVLEETLEHALVALEKTLRPGGKAGLR
jgi:hypothetical protein